MKKIVLLLFGLMFAGVFAFADIGIGAGGGYKITSYNIDSGDLFKPIEVLEVKGIEVLKPDNPMYSKSGQEWNKLNINTIVCEFIDYRTVPISKKIEVGWQGYTDI